MAIKPQESGPEQALLEEARLQLLDLLPKGWELREARTLPDELAEADFSDLGADAATDATWQLGDPDTRVYASIVVEAKRSMAPRDVDHVLGGSARLLRRLLRSPILVVAPWLSPRTRDLLTARDFAYLDLTGNVSLRLTRPALYLRLEGAQRAPTQAGARAPAALTGARAGRLVRILTDVQPPYRLTELARVTDLNPGYVSRLLTSLSEQALLERTRGRVTHVDWTALLRLRAEAYDPLRTGRVLRYLAPRGARAAYQELSTLTDAETAGPVVTGSFAAVAVAPVAAPAQLLAYSRQPEQDAQRLGLLPAEAGADSLLITPADPGVTARTRVVDGVRHVALSQLVLDCLAGNGRLPAEGEAVLSWMTENENLWRLPSLAELPVATDAAAASAATSAAAP